MKYIKTYESFKNDKINEGIFGKLFGKLKNKLSMGFSKMFGSAAKVDKLIEEYKNEILKAQEQKRLLLKNYGDYIKSVKDGGETDENKLKEIKANYKKADDTTTKQLEIIKQKFDIKFNAIVKEEENPKIKDFITLKKLEMQQELLQDELSVIFKDSGLKEEDVKDDPFFKELSKGISSKIQANNKSQEEQKTALSKEDSKNDEESDSDKKYEEGDKVLYKKKDGTENEGVVKSADGDNITLTTDKNKSGFAVNKDKIIKKLEEETEA